MKRYRYRSAGKRDCCATRPLRRERKRSVRDRCRHLLRIVAFCLYFIAVSRDIIGNIDRIRFPHDCSDLLAVLHFYGRFALCDGCDHEIGIDCDLLAGLFAFTADQPCHEFKVLISRNARLRQRELRPAADLRLHAVNAHRVCTICRYLKRYKNICTRECNRRFAFCLRRYGERILRHGSRHLIGIRGTRRHFVPVRCDVFGNWKYSVFSDRAFNIHTVFDFDGFHRLCRGSNGDVKRDGHFTAYERNVRFAGCDCRDRKDILRHRRRCYGIVR